MYTLETFLQVKMNDNRLVIGRVHSTEPILAIQPFGSADVFYETQFSVVREVSTEEINSLLQTSKPLAKAV
jgi:hypothetical protein